MKINKILIIAAHPDDEVLGAGGTIAKYVQKGCKVDLLIVTDGSTSQYKDNPRLNEIIEEKKLETRDCADFLGISDIYYGNLPDMKLDMTPHVEINQVIESVIDKVQPDTVFTHFYGDVNKDHKCVCESTLVACRPTENQCVKNLFLYSVPSSTEWNLQLEHTAFIPNWYENLDEKCAELKYKGMSCYTEELREYPHPRSIEYLRNEDIYTGNKVGKLCSESFILVRSVND